MSTPRETTALAAVMAAACFFAACDGDERVEPLGGSGGGASSSTTTVTGSTSAATTGSAGTGGEGGGTPIRTLIQRDPFGNVAETRNLLWDGDFEWESAFADQYGWLQGQTASVTARRVGPDCRSGLKCGVLGADLIGIALSSAAHDLYASVWVRPGEGASCASVTAYLLAEGIYDDGADVVIPPVADAPDETGWCHFEATVAQRDDKSYLYVASTAVAPALVDDAVVREATGDEARRVARHAAWVPTAEVYEKLQAAHGVIRKWRGPHEGAPNPTREELVRSGRGEGVRRFVAAPHVHRGGPR